MTSRGTAIACIAWGSLVWDPRHLPLAGAWHDDGPLLPVEFARESVDGRITLVICPGVPDVRCCWGRLDVPQLAAARRALGAREFGRPDAPGIDRHIGWWDGHTDQAHGQQADAVRTWAAGRGLAGAVWTDLPPRFGGVDGRVPSGDEVVAHLRALPPDARARAERYVRRAPAQTATALRRRLEAELGWHADGAAATPRLAHTAR